LGPFLAFYPWGRTGWAGSSRFSHASRAASWAETRRIEAERFRM